jgi:hypothetical protein
MLAIPVLVVVSVAFAFPPGDTVFVTTVDDVESHKPIVVAKVTCVMPEPEGALTLMFSE